MCELLRSRNESAVIQNKIHREPDNENSTEPKPELDEIHIKDEETDSIFSDEVNSDGYLSNSFM